MLSSLRTLCLGLSVALTLSAATAMAASPAASVKSTQNYVGSNTMPSNAPHGYKMIVGGSYSPALGAEFRIENFYLPAFGQFTGVRLVSAPSWNSPLSKLGLQAGDVITRLDGVRADNLAELENHYSWTEVRYIKTGTQSVKIANIYINNNVGPQPGPFPLVNNMP